MKSRHPKAKELFRLSASNRSRNYKNFIKNYYGKKSLTKRKKEVKTRNLPLEVRRQS